VFEEMEERITVAQTDQGKRLQVRVDDLLRLLEAYRSGMIPERH